MTPPRLVVIGYGNDLRGDDAVGPLAAREVARWNREGVAALATPLLTPELAEVLSRCEEVVFVDASVASQAVEVREVTPAARPGLGHTSDPATLLALTRDVYDRLPRAWLVAVPAGCLELGAGLSSVGRRGLTEALEVIRHLADRCVPEGSIPAGGTR